MGQLMVTETLTKQLIMVATSLLQRLMWILRYPSFAPESGMHRVGAIQTRLSSNSVACQIHYPTQITKTNIFTSYFRPLAVSGLSDYSKTPASILDFLSRRQHPCLINGEPLSLSSLSSSKTTKFPIVLFSHGLGGCMEMYTQLCQQISSHGFIVIALEHEDGSGAYAEQPLPSSSSNNEGQTSILYKRPDDSPYSREKVLKFRQPFLDQRVNEINTIVDILLNYDDKSDINEQDMTTMNPLLPKVLQISDTTKGMSYVGHSFGGVSMILATQKAFIDNTNDDSTRSDIKKQRQPNSLTVFDPWCFAVSDDVLGAGVVSSTTPTLSILSESWATNNPETKQVDYWLQNCVPSMTTSHYIPNTVHASISDASTWLPRFVGSKVYMCHKNERKHWTIPTAAKVCVQHIQNAINNYNTNIDQELDATPHNNDSNEIEHLQNYIFQSSTGSALSQQEVKLTKILSTVT